MTYTSLLFALFACITIIIYFTFPRREYRWSVLLAASYFFYIYNSYRYTAFILFTTVTIYLAGRWLSDISEKASAELKANKGIWDRDEKKAFKKSVETKKKRLLAATLVLNFGILFVIKYLNFLAGGLMHLMGAPAHDAQIISIILPLGISFYTFQATGYLIDVYRETAEAEQNIFKFALFVSFFPQIIQGPISSYTKLHHQLIEPHDIDWLNFKHGVMIIAWGLFKKLVIADCAWIGIKAYYDNGGINGVVDFGGFGGTMVLFISLMYALQLYADFSGGIDISRGICRILGIDLEMNFRQPYFSKSIGE